MLATPKEPIYILEEHVTPEAVTLRAKHNGKGGFTFSNSSQGASAELIFTVDSRSGLRAPHRLIKDATGTGILELWRNPTGDESYVGHPKGASPPLAVVAPRKTMSKDKLDVYVKTAGGETKLEVRGQDIWKRNTLVYCGDDLMMQMKFVNYITTYVPFSSNQWDVAVAQGFDLSLVSSFIFCQFARYTADHHQACAIVVYLGTTLYDSSKFQSNYGLEHPEYRDTKWTSNKPLIPSYILGGAAGGAAG